MRHSDASKKGPCRYCPILPALLVALTTAAGAQESPLAEGNEVIVAAPVPQDEALATYAPKIDKQDARLDWRLPATALARQVRAYDPFPGAFLFAGDLRIKVWRATPVSGGHWAPGEVVRCNRDGVVVACGEGALQLDELQLPGKRRVSAAEFAAQLDLAGRRLD